MKFKAICSTNVRISMLCTIVVGFLVTSGQAGSFATNGAKWFKKVMPLFTAPNVPNMGPSETEAPSPKVVLPVPPRLPGKGMAQHSMLYIGEGYNKMFLVNKGKIIWTYSTGPGNEYDDVWMLSNGNVLFTRMQYIAEVTPDKKMVWRYDAPPGTEFTRVSPSVGIRCSSSRMACRLIS
jgi:hypothetical protein